MPRRGSPGPPRRRSSPRRRKSLSLAAEHRLPSARAPPDPGTLVTPAPLSSSPAPWRVVPSSRGDCLPGTETTHSPTAAGSSSPREESPGRAGEARPTRARVRPPRPTIRPPRSETLPRATTTPFFRAEVLALRRSTLLSRERARPLRREDRSASRTTPVAPEGARVARETTLGRARTILPAPAEALVRRKRNLCPQGDEDSRRGTNLLPRAVTLRRAGATPSSSGAALRRAGAGSRPLGEKSSFEGDESPERAGHPRCCAGDAPSGGDESPPWRGRPWPSGRRASSAGRRLASLGGRASPLEERISIPGGRAFPLASGSSKPAGRPRPCFPRHAPGKRRTRLLRNPLLPRGRHVAFSQRRARDLTWRTASPRTTVSRTVVPTSPRSLRADVLRAHVLHVPAVDHHNLVPGPEARLLGGGAGRRLVDDQRARLVVAPEHGAHRAGAGGAAAGKGQGREHEREGEAHRGHGGVVGEGRRARLRAT